MADATARFFDALGERGHEPLLEKATGTLRFDLDAGGRTDRWLVTVERGDVTVSRKAAKADVVVRTDRALFDKLASGRKNAMAAILRGEIGIEGRVQLLALFQRLFPSPPKRRSR
jgi:putative sterol carrier protein